MAVGLSPQFQEEVCDICKKEGEVRVLFDSEKKLTAFICADCAKNSKDSAEEIMKKYGKPGRLKKAKMADKNDSPQPDFEIKKEKKTGG